MHIFIVHKTLFLPFPDSQFEERFEEIGTGPPSTLLSKSTFSEKPSSTLTEEDGNRKEIQMPGYDHHGPSPGLNFSQDFVSGIMKIVPSDVDVGLCLLAIFFTFFRDLNS